MSAIQFQVIDLSCEAADQSFFPPRISMSTRSTTKIATVLGYPEYIPSTPPKKYKTLTWSGTSEQTAFTTNPAGGQVADVKYVYSGFGQIDSKGNITSKYAKDVYTPCPESNFNPEIIINAVIKQLQGYCWPPDPKTCPTCTYPPEFKENIQANAIFDEPIGLLGVGTGFHTITSTSLTNIGAQAITATLADSGPGGTTEIPKDEFNGIHAAWVNIAANHNYSSALTDEYTDSEALTNAQVVISNGSTAENRPRTNGFVSRFTSVVFTLSMSDLIVGKSYLVTVHFRDQNFHVTQKQYGVVASKPTATLVDIISTPPAGGTSTVYGPSIAFVP
jgi:hypothetical protein